MLSDIERKTMRIINNVSFYGMQPRMPSIDQLMRWTGRSRGGVYNVLRSLSAKGYIEWSADEPEKIVLQQTGVEQRRGHWEWR